MMDKTIRMTTRSWIVMMVAFLICKIINIIIFELSEIEANGYSALFTILVAITIGEFKLKEE